MHDILIAKAARDVGSFEPIKAFLPKIVVHQHGEIAPCHDDKAALRSISTHSLEPRA